MNQASDHVSILLTIDLTTDQPGDVRVPDHLRVCGALHLSGLPPALHQVRDQHVIIHGHDDNHCQAPLPDLLPKDGSPGHGVLHSVHSAHLLHAGQLV